MTRASIKFFLSNFPSIFAYNIRQKFLTVHLLKKIDSYLLYSQSDYYVDAFDDSPFIFSEKNDSVSEFLMLSSLAFSSIPGYY